MNIEKLYECMAKNNVNQSHAREAIYRVLVNAKGTCLSMSNIEDELLENYPKSVSINTIYRHLNLFVSCRLVLTLQDDNKKTYYCLRDSQLSVFQICTKCKKIEKCNMSIDAFCDQSEEIDFCTVHKKCQACR